MAGRPSKLTRQVEADLTLLLAQGVPVKVAAAATDVSPRSVRRWLNEGDLRERVAEIRATERASADAASDEARLVVLLLRAAQHNWRASAWWLERRYPEHWGAERMEA
jgi:transposase